MQSTLSTDRISKYSNKHSKGKKKDISVEHLPHAVLQDLLDVKTIFGRSSNAFTANRNETKTNVSGHCHRPYAARTKNEYHNQNQFFGRCSKQRTNVSYEQLFADYTNLLRPKLAYSG